MSVFGGDNWGSEANYRKRRVDDLVTEGLRESAHKKLSNGKYVCLVCPRNPILDSPLMLSMHCKGSRHLASESKLKEREPMKEKEIQKMISIPDCNIDIPSRTASSLKHCLENRPSAAQTCILASGRKAANSNSGLSLSGVPSSCEPLALHKDSCCSPSRADGLAVAPQQLDIQEHREKELKFASAGWKRDCHGNWFRDENVEFDSDEEDPNVCLT